jgi:hypothetical protein
VRPGDLQREGVLADRRFAAQFPSGLKATELGLPSVMNGEPVTAVSAPPTDTENTETVPSLELAVASRPPSGLKATELGVMPVVNGEPATGVSAPTMDTENTETVPSLELAVASRPPSGLKATELGVVPVGDGGPATGVSTPATDTENTDTVLSSELAVASSPPLGLKATPFGLRAGQVGGAGGGTEHGRRTRQRTGSADQPPQTNQSADDRRAAEARAPARARSNTIDRQQPCTTTIHRDPYRHERGMTRPQTREVPGAACYRGTADAGSCGSLPSACCWIRASRREAVIGRAK